ISTNRYLIQDFIGEGSFGKIAKAVNLSTSQDVALKILKTEDTADREVDHLISCGLQVSSICKA
uniref:Protein kinase domain-containing protein n=1 Tax=Lates calcarifer TaxID=8187 RepID=A0A4W6C1D3_LATCA